MFVSELFEGDGRQTLVVYPGRFQIFHKGHAAVYNHLCEKYGAGNVYIVTSNKVEPPRSPFSFDDKKKMMELTGVDPSHIVFDAQPYQAKGLVANFDANNTVLLFAISEKDMAEDPRFQFKPKKDGSPSYFQPLDDLRDAKTLDQHGYITTVPTFNFEVLGQPANSATQIRTQFASSDEATQKRIVTDLFGKFDPTVYKIMKTKLTGVNEGTPVNVNALMSRADKAGTSAPWWARAGDTIYMGSSPKPTDDLKYKLYFPDMVHQYYDKTTNDENIKAAEDLNFEQDENGNWYYPVYNLDQATKREITRAKYLFGEKTKKVLVNKKIKEDVEADNQIFKIQSKYDVTRQEALQMYYVDGVRVEEPKESNESKSLDESYQLITEEVVATIPVADKMQLLVTSHFLDRLHNREGHQEMTTREIAASVYKLAKVRKKMARIPLGQQFWVIDHANSVSLGLRRIMDSKDGTMKNVLGTVITPLEDGTLFKIANGFDNPIINVS